MFGIGFPEMVVIAIVALIFIGPKKLPEFMKAAGKMFVQVRRTAGEVRHGFEQVVREAEDELHREEAEKIKQALLVAPAGQEPDHHAHQLDEQHNPDGTLKTHGTQHPVEPPPASSTSVAAKSESDSAPGETKLAPPEGALPHQLATGPGTSTPAVADAGAKSPGGSGP